MNRHDIQKGLRLANLDQPVSARSSPRGSAYLETDGDAASAAEIRRSASAKTWGQLPEIAVAGAVGLLVVAVADTGARAGAPWASLAFWIGLLLQFGPVAGRLASARPSRSERIGLVGLLGLQLYLIKVLHSPLAFTLHDEFSHWRTANDIARSGHLFSENPLLPVSPVYPGLENVTSALTSLSGLSIFAAGIILIALARVLLAVALYLFYEDASGSARIAGLATLFYMANPSFLFFDAQFSYESLALPLAAFALVAVSRSQRGARKTSLGLVGVILLALGATITTHHVTGLFLSLFLVVWTATAAYVNRGKVNGASPGWTALASLAMVLAWTNTVGSALFGYLAPILEQGPQALLKLALGMGSLRRPFSDYAGQSLAWPERVVGYLSVVLILVGLAVGLRWVWRRYRDNALALALAATALPYPLSLALRMTDQGAEASSRTSEFLFLGIAFVLAVAAEEYWLSRSWNRRRAAWFVGWATVVFTGGVVLGAAPWARLPGPYLVAADSRSVDQQSVGVAEWTLRHLGPNNRFAADRTNGMLVGSYGEQRLVTALVDHVGVWPPFFTPTFDALDEMTIQRGRIHFLVIDRRLSTGLPRVGVYVEIGEVDTYHHRTPINPAALSKFDGMPRVSRLLDSGDIAIYDVEALAHAP